MMNKFNKNDTIQQDNVEKTPLDRVLFEENEIKSLSSQRKFKEMEQKVLSTLMKQQEEMPSKRVRTSIASPTPSILSKGRHFVPNYEQMYKDLQKKYEKAILENSKLNQIFALRQENFIQKEKKANEEIMDLKNKLQRASTIRKEQNEQMEQLRHMRDMIFNQIKQMKGQTQKKLLEKHEKYNETVDKIVKKFKEEFEKEKKKNFYGEKEWAEMHENLKKDLEDAISDALLLDKKNTKLMSLNKELKKIYSAQEGDSTILRKRTKRLKKENERLKKELAELERKYELVKAARIPKVSAFYSEPTINVTNEREINYAETLERYRRLIEKERKNLKSVRSSHIELLAERTELEIFLKQCIEDLRENISKHSQRLAKSEELFSPIERQRVIDILVSKERVLNLLYEKTFPNKPHIYYTNTIPEMEKF